jgi:hypothetical protein
MFLKVPHTSSNAVKKAFGCVIFCSLIDTIYNTI